MELENIKFNLTDTLEKTVDLLSEKAANNNLVFITFVENNVPRQLQGNQKYFCQILSNFLENAIQLIQQGEILVQASLESETATTIILQCSVKVISTDLDSAAIEKFCQSFGLENTIPTSQDSLISLDFTLSQHLIKVMKGRIGAKSINQEIIFWFQLPLLKQTFLESSHPEFLSNPSIMSALKYRRLFIIDAHTTRRKILQAQTTAWGMVVDSAKDSLEALNKLHTALENHHAYDVVILDINLPDIPGKMLADLIKADSALSDLKIILLTSVIPSISDKKNAKFQDANYLLKPVKESCLLDILVNTLQSSLGVKNLVENHSKNIAHEPTKKTQDYPRLSVEPNSSHSLKILLVEDNFINRKVALSQLMILGYRADYATNGQEALNLLAQKNYDLVFMDCQMPVLDGFAATKILRKEEGKNHHTIVIAMTANAMQEDRDRCLEAGMDDYLSKPVSVQELERILKSWTPVNPSQITTDSPRKIPPIYPDILPENQSIPKKSSPELSDLQPLVNLKRLEEISGNDPEFAREIMQNFISECEIKLPELQQALLTQNFKAVENLAHWLKGASGNVGIDSLQAQCSHLEALARREDLSAGTELFTPLEQLLKNVKKILAN